MSAWRSRDTIASSARARIASDGMCAEIAAVALPFKFLAARTEELDSRHAAALLRLRPSATPSHVRHQPSWAAHRVRGRWPHQCPHPLEPDFHYRHSFSSWGRARIDGASARPRSLSIETQVARQLCKLGGAHPQACRRSLRVRRCRGRVAAQSMVSCDIAGSTGHKLPRMPASR